MARKRMIDPSIWSDEGMAQLTARQQLLYVGLISNADDDGRLKGSPVAVALLLPVVYQGVPVAEVAADLDAVLDAMTALVRYEVAGRPYLAFTNYRKWQRIDRPSPSTLPGPDGDDSTSVRRVVAESSPSVPRGVPPNRREGRRREENVENPPCVPPVDERGADAPPPADDSVRELVREPVVEDEPAAAPTPIRAVPKPKAPLTELPRDWDVSDELWAWAEEKGLPREHVEFENEKFVDYHRGKGTKNKDWPAVWRNWLRNAPQFTRGQGRGAGSSRQATPTPFRPQGSRVVAAPEAPIPDGWWPTEEQLAAARRFGMTAEQVEIQTQEFVANARVTGQTAKDWHGKWQTRMRFVAQTGVAQ